MDISKVFIKKYDGFFFDEREILRYAGCRDDGDDEEMLRIMRECEKEACEKGLLKFSVCYRFLPVRIGQEGVIDFDVLKVKSLALAKCLGGCSDAVFMAATIGIGMDRLTARYNRTDPVKALFMQAIGAQQVEALCDAFCNELSAETAKDGLCLTPRFSPGYGDLPLDIQPQFLSIVEAGKMSGITLNDSLLMSPSKSVTAIVGIRKIM